MPAIDAYRTFARQHVLGQEARLDERGDTNALHDALARAGLAGWWIAPRYGGQGLSFESGVEVVSELAYADAGLAFSWFLPVLPTTMISLFGSEAQRQQVLGAVAKGGSCALSASEKDAGSELLRTSCAIERQGDRFVITGDKYFSTNAGRAAFIVVTGRERDTGEHMALVVPRDAPGLHIGRRWPVNGVRASETYELKLERCAVPVSAKLEGHAVRVLEVGLNGSRLFMAASALGIMRRARDLALAYAQTKEVRGAPLHENDVFGAKLGQMEVEIDGVTAVVQAAARELDALLAGPDAAERMLRRGAVKSVIVAKMLAGQRGFQVVSTASEMFGGLGYTEDHLIGKLLRDVRYVSIVEAGDDALRDLIYRRHVLPAFEERST